MSCNKKIITSIMHLLHCIFAETSRESRNTQATNCIAMKKNKFLHVDKRRWYKDVSLNI